MNNYHLSGQMKSIKTVGWSLCGWTIKAKCFSAAIIQCEPLKGNVVNFNGFFWFEFFIWCSKFELLKF